MRKVAEVVITSRFLSQVVGEMDVIHIVRTRTILEREDKKCNGTRGIWPIHVMTYSRSRYRNLWLQREFFSRDRNLGDIECPI